MTHADEASAAVPKGLPAAPPQLTTHIPNCATIPLDALAGVDHGTLNRLLPSRLLSGPSFNSSI
jgi:hypothetical protein